MLFFGQVNHGRAMRVNHAPTELFPFVPPKSEQRVRIAQLGMLAILLAILSFGPALGGSYCRIQLENVFAMNACFNGYSGNPYMATLAGEIRLELFHFDVAPRRHYVLSKLHLAGI